MSVHVLVVVKHSIILDWDSLMLYPSSLKGCSPASEYVHLLCCTVCVQSVFKVADAHEPCMFSSLFTASLIPLFIIHPVDGSQHKL